MRISGEIRRNFSILSTLPCSKKWVDNTLVFKSSGAIVEWIMSKFPDAEWHISSQKVRDRWLACRKEETDTIAAKGEILVDDTGYQFHSAPYAHQKQAFLLGRAKPAFAYFHEQGCGKTKVTIDDFCWNFEQKNVNALVVIAPNGVHSNWIDVEIPEHMPTRIKTKCHIYSAGMKKSDRDKMIWDITHIKDDVAYIFAFNVEGFVSQKAKDLFEQILKTFKCFLVVDESNCIQNPGAERTKYIVRTGPKSIKRRILTGTPMTKGLENLYSQFKFLDPNILGYTNFTAFKAHFCIMGGFENHQIVDYQNVEEIQRRLAGYSHRALKQDCLDLPKKIYKRHRYQMCDEQLKLYHAINMKARDSLEQIKKLEKLEQLVGEKSANQLMSEQVITTMLRLQQISCGWYPGETGQVDLVPFKSNPRLELFLELLEGVEGKAIIWCNAPGSRADIRLLAEKLTKMRAGFLEYHGAIKDDDRRQAIYEFQNNSKFKFMLCSKAAHAGLTLTAADQAFYYTNNFSLRIRLQSEDRCHRIGSEIHKHVLYHDFSGSRIDDKIIKTLREAKELADMVTQDPYAAFMDVSAESAQ
jgi:hypothetical protein